MNPLSDDNVIFNGDRVYQITYPTVTWSSVKPHKEHDNIRDFIDSQFGSQQVLVLDWLDRAIESSIDFEP